MPYYRQPKISRRAFDTFAVLDILVGTYPYPDVPTLRNISYFINKLLNHLFNDSFDYQFKKCLTDDCIEIESLKFRFQNTFLFRVIFLNSLKFRKSLFNDDQNETIHFLNFVINEILLTIEISKPLSATLLKLLEVIFTKQPKVLRLDVSWVTLKAMMHFATSGIVSFKKSAQDISKLCLNNEGIQTFLNNFNKMNLRGTDYEYLLNTAFNEEMICSPELSNDEAFALFKNNVNSRDGAILYKAVLQPMVFEDFLNKLWRVQKKLISRDKHNLESEFHQSMIKYWIPLSVKYYRNDFYLRIKNSSVSLVLKATALLETKRDGCYMKTHDNDVYKYLRYPQIEVIALKILCHYNKKSFPDYQELNAVEKFIWRRGSRNQGEIFGREVAQCIEQIVSQLFFIIHYKYQNEELELRLGDLYSKFIKRLFDYSMKMFDANFELSSQLLLIIWKISIGSSKDLATSFQIEKNIQYDTRENIFYKSLEKEKFWEATLLSEQITLKINEFLNKPKKEVTIGPSLCIKLITNYYLDRITLPDNNNCLTTLIFESLSCDISIQTIEKFKEYLRLLMKHKIFHESDLRLDLESLEKNYKKSKSTEDLFISTLILEVYCIIREDYVLDLGELLEETLNFIATIFEENSQEELDIKSVKVLECFINSYLQLFKMSRNNWADLNKNVILKGLSTIIEKSELKRPMATSVNALEEFSKYLENNLEHSETETQFLDEIFDNLEANTKITKMRRNPETRLVIQALCHSEIDLEKLKLNKSISVLLESISAHEKEGTVSSALHCLEILLSDTTLQYATLKYVPIITEQCLQCFNSKNWVIRNGAMQVLKCLVERFLGVAQENGNRTKSIIDFFNCYPEMTKIFLNVLPEHGEGALDDRAFAVLVFFSESHVGMPPFDEESLRVLNIFKRIFVNIIKNYGNHIGETASKSLAALCLLDEIPSVLFDLVHYIKTHHRKIKRYTLKNMLLYMELLYDKFTTSPSRDEDAFIAIKRILSDLFKHVHVDRTFVHNLLPYTMNSNCLLPMGVRSENTRVRLQNYVLDLARNVNDQSNLMILKFYLSNDESLDQTHIFALTGLLDRFKDKKDSDSAIVNSVINVLLNTLETLNPSRIYLAESYCQAILIIYRSSKNFQAEEIDGDLDTDNLYKILVYLTCFPYTYLLESPSFLIRAVDKCLDAINEGNESLMLEISTVLIPLIGLSLCVHNLESRMKIFRLAVSLSFKSEPIKYQTLNFIRMITNHPCASSFFNLLDLDNLLKYIENKRLVLIFLKDISNFIETEIEDVPNIGLISRKISILAHSLHNRQ